MKKIINKTILFALCSTAVVACKPTFDEPKATSGSVDFSKFVMIGDGTPGGYADACLNREAQLAAYPNLLAEQFKLVGGGEFIQPLVEVGKSYGFENNKANSIYVLGYHTFCNSDKPELYPEPTYTISLVDIITFTVTPAPVGQRYNNLAAQGAKLIYINKNSAWQGTSDTYWKKISRSNNMDTTMVQDAKLQKPTFLGINIGTVDAMRYAKSGGDQDNGDDDFITPVNRFRDSLYSAFNVLTAKNTNGLKGFITNIIDLNSFPYVTYIKYNGLILDDVKAAELNTFWAGKFSFHAGKNNYVISDPAVAGGVRQIKDDEFILIEIPQDSLRCYGLGGKLPIRPRWVLDRDEIKKQKEAVDSYNEIIKACALAYGFAYVDGNKAMKLVKDRRLYSGIDLNTDFVNGNQFTIDGLNISPFGQALLANNCIVEINNKYGSTVPFIDATKIRSVKFK
jgi:hypothetical protein